jgi:BON domain
VSETAHLPTGVGRSIRRSPIGVGRAGVVMLLANLLGGVGFCLAQDAARQPSAALDEVLVQGSRSKDEQITERVQSALANDPWIYAEHITVTTENGVVRVEGITSDTWEMRRILREARRTAGVRRVLNQLEMLHLDPEGG